MNRKLLFVSLAVLFVFLLMFTSAVLLAGERSSIYWSAFIPAALIMASIPGANQILSLRNGLRKGAKTAIIAAGGRFAAFTLMIFAVALGLSAVLQASTILFSVIKWVGVMYLAWLGVRTLFSSRGEYEPEHEEEKKQEHIPGEAWMFARQEFMVAAANPKALLLFTVFLPQFIPTSTNGAGGQILVAGAAYILIEAVCAAGYAVIGGRLRHVGVSGAVKKSLDRVTGAAMIGLAAWLSTEKSR